MSFNRNLTQINGGGLKKRDNLCYLIVKKLTLVPTNFIIF